MHFGILGTVYSRPNGVYACCWLLSLLHHLFCDGQTSVSGVDYRYRVELVASYFIPHYYACDSMKCASNMTVLW